MPEQDDFFGEIISSYTRAQAIEDGVLVDLSDPSFTFRPGLPILKEAGIKFPVAMTTTAFARTVQDPDTDEPLPPGQDVSGRLWDVLTVFKLYAQRNRGDTILFPVSVQNWVRINGKRKESVKQEDVNLKAVCGPGDKGEPVITIMLPDED
jgi:hypothetical protein